MAGWFLLGHSIYGVWQEDSTAGGFDACSLNTVSGNTMSQLLHLKNMRFAIVGQEAYGENASRGGSR